MLDAKRSLGIALAAVSLAVLPGSAVAQAARGSRAGVAQRCSSDWQLVSYALLFYLEAPGLQAKEQLLHELVVDLRRARRACRAIQHHS